MYVTNIIPVAANRQTIDTIDGQNSALVFVGPDPLLQAGLSNGYRMLTLFGPNGNYQIESTTNLSPPYVWTNEFTAVLTNLYQVFPGITNNNTSKFYRAQAF
jgi:hypothetical protein